MSCGVTRRGNSSTALRKTYAVGRSSTATASAPSLAASCGIEPKPAKGSSTFLPLIFSTRRGAGLQAWTVLRLCLQGKRSFRNCSGVWYASAGSRDAATTALAPARGFRVHQNTISQCGGRPGPFSTAEYSLIASIGMPRSRRVSMYISAS
jgi:hypothetical protein